MKRIFNFPEITLVGLGSYWIIEKYIEIGRISYITLLVTWLLFLQIIYKNRITGLLYGFMLGAVACYKLYSTSVLAEEITTAKVIELFVIFSLALVMSAAMLFKYAKTRENYGESILTVAD